MDDEGTPQTAEDWAFTAGKNYKTSVRFVLISLARCIDKSNNCPSHKDLSEMTGVSKDTIRRALGELEKDGLIAIVKNGGGKVKGGQKDCYRLPKYMQPASTQPASTQDTGSMVQPGCTMPIGTEQPGSKSEDARTHVSDAATRVTDMSEKIKAKEKDKDKKPLSPGKAGDSQAVTENIPRPPRARNPLFDAIALHIFALTTPAAVSAAGGRIGKMLANFPAEKDTLTPERIAQFARWWAANKRTPDNKPLSKPLDAGKLATHWSDFERQCPIRLAAPSETTARIEANRRELEQEHRRIQREMGMTV